MQIVFFIKRSDFLKIDVDKNKMLLNYLPILHSLRRIEAKEILGVLFSFLEDFYNFAAVVIIYVWKLIKCKTI